jgi:hypothetical protein
MLMHPLRREQAEVLGGVVRGLFVKVVNYPALRKWPPETDGNDFIGLPAVIVHGCLAASFPLMILRSATLKAASLPPGNGVLIKSHANNFGVNTEGSCDFTAALACLVAVCDLLEWKMNSGWGVIPLPDTPPMGNEDSRDL